MREEDSLQARASCVSAAASPTPRCRRCSASTGPAGATGTFDAGIQFGVETNSCGSRAFCSESNAIRRQIAPNTVYRIGDLELASRLSFFLWSSIPDDELLDLAVRGKLKDPAVLEQQVRRMLADARSNALVDNFVGQWLLLRNIRSVQPRARPVPGFRRRIARVLPAGNRTVRRQPVARGSKPGRAVERELHVRQRAPGAALPDSQRLRQRLSARDVRHATSRAAA